MIKNEGWILKRRPDGPLSSEDLIYRPIALPALSEGQVLVRNLLLSLDPTNRLWMSERDQYLPPVGIDEVMRGVTIGRVVDSRSERFAPGDIVQPANGGWQSHVVADARTTRRVHTDPDIDLTAYMSVLGVTGLTAYFGLLDICTPQPGETIVISAAAGAVGSVAGQIARLKGCKVIGIAGGPDKCAWLMDELGFDGVIDYKSEDVGAALDRLCPDGVDMNFENVGGAIMEAVFNRLRPHGRMALCGMISAYNREGPISGPADFGRILMNRLTVRGFIVIDYLSRTQEAVSNLTTWTREGRIKWKDHVIDGLEHAPTALERLFTGQHDGKLMIRI